jgi:Ca2+-binding RTX toxin-like protein
MRRQKLGTFLGFALAALVFAAVAMAATMRGTQGNDNITGSGGPDKIIAKKGNDTVNALGGDDRVSGGRGTDTLNGDDGNDSLWGGADNDTLNGGLGDDSLRGKAGNDTLNGDAGNDFLNGGKDADTNTINGGDGDDFVFSRGDGNKADNVDCGGGTNDTVRADKNDVLVGCEHIDRSGDGNTTKPPKPPKP